MERNASFETITPELAKEYLKLNCENRAVNKGIVNFYADMMSRGEWKPNGQSIIFNKSGQMIDGQHRLMASIQSGCTFESLVVRGVEDETFTTIDQGHKRTACDVMHLNEVKNAAGVTGIINRYLASHRCTTDRILTVSSGHADKRGWSNKVSNQSVLDEYKKCPEYWQDVFGFCKACTSRLNLIPISEIGGMIAKLNLDLNYDYDYVCDFFRQIFFEKETKNDTLALLRNRLVKQKMSNVKMTQLCKEQLFVKAWKAYKRGTVLKRLIFESRDEVMHFE